MLLSAAIVFWVSSEAQALEKSAYPQRTINYIMGFPPGGKSDIQARGNTFREQAAASAITRYSRPSRMVTPLDT